MNNSVNVEVKKNDAKYQDPRFTPEFQFEQNKFYNENYIKTLNLKKFTRINFCEYLEQTERYHYWSHLNRLKHNIQALKCEFIHYKTKVIVTSFTASAGKDTCIYGYLYSLFNLEKGSSIEHEYVCTGPTFNSQDGEYRSKIISWDQFNSIFIKYKQECEEVEALIVGRINTEQIAFQTNFYYPENFNYNERKFEDSINVLRLPIKLFILCWLYDFYQIYTNSIENHVNSAYKTIIYNPEEITTMEKIIARIGSINYTSMMNHIAHSFEDINKPNKIFLIIRVGQKIFPLTVSETVKCNDINYNVWREIYISTLTSNLVINLISPSFPVINNWFYIQTAHEGLFDNAPMRIKYSYSDIATKISTQMRELDKLNYVEKNREKGPINNKFMRMSRLMQKSIAYADGDIRLTELAICLTNEFVGRTLRDIPSLIASGIYESGFDLVFADLNLFTRHIFEFIYSFYCMNIKIGIFHGDLHLNNVTIYQLYYMTTTKGEYCGPKNAQVVYLVGEVAYMFPHYGLFSTIIDFSRAIIGNYKLIEHDFSARFAELYFKDQRLRVLNILHHYFPKLMEKFRNKIESLLISNFPLMFKILSGIDTYVIVSNINAMLDIDVAFTQGKIKIASGASKFLTSLANHAEYLIISHIQAAIEGRITSEDDIEWPNLQIITKFFSNWILTPEKMKNRDFTIIDIFNSNSDVTYDISSYESWGPLLRFDHQLELYRKFGMEIPQTIKRWQKHKNTDESILMDLIVSKYKPSKKEILDFESWMLL